VGHRLEADAHRPDLELVGRVVLAQVEGVLDQVVVAPSADHPPERVARPRGNVQLGAGGAVRAGPAVHRHGLLARRVGERVGERDEVEEVVRVEVRDHDGVHVHVVDPLAQLAEHAVAAIDHDSRAVLLEEIARAGAAGVLPGGRLAEDRQPHGGSLPRR
jgi:hypothetical protein